MNMDLRYYANSTIYKVLTLRRYTHDMVILVRRRWTTSNQDHIMLLGQKNLFYLHREAKP